MKNLFSAGLIVFGLTSAQASTIADFTQEFGASNPFSFTNNAGVSDTFSGTNIPVFFRFDSAPGPIPFGGAYQNAFLTISGTSFTAGTITGVHLEEVGFVGSFTIIHQTLGTNLLSGTFNVGATGTGHVFGSEATFADATPPPTEVTYSSDYLVLGSTTNRAFSLSLSGLTNPLTLGLGGMIDSTSGNAVGTFSADEEIRILETPEPLTLSLIGASLIGLALMRRRKID